MPNALRLKSATKKSSALLAEHFTRLYDSDDPVQMFRRFNLSGVECKGQLSSGYGQAGYGVQVKAGFDFGDLIGPGLIELKANATAGGQRSEHTLLVCTRFPRVIYDVVVSTLEPAAALTDKVNSAPARAAPAPNLTSARPILLGVLNGTAWQGTLKASAKASFSPPDAWVSDEFNFSASASATAEGDIRLVSLIDPILRSFAEVSVTSVHDTSLADAVDVELSGDLKKRVAAWIARMKKNKNKLLGDGSDSSDSSDQGNDNSSDESKDEGEVEDDSKEDSKEEGKEDSDDDSEDDDEEKGKDKNEGPSDEAPEVRVSKLKALAKKLKKPLTAINALFKAWKNKPANTAKLRVLLAELRSEFEDAGDTDAVERIDDFNAALDERERAKKNAVVAPPRADDDRPLSVMLRVQRAQAPPPSVFRLSAQGFQGKLQAEAEATLTLRKKKLSAEAQGEFEVTGKRVKFRFQAVGGESAPGPVVLTQDTYVVHSLFKAAGSAKASLGSKSKPASGSRVYGTITYRSVAAYWLASSAMAYPNGSGLSFGLSIDGDRLVDYADWCRLGAGSSMSPEVKKTEDYLSSQLRVATVVLQPFFAAFEFNKQAQNPKTGKLERTFATALLVESGFAFSATTPLTMIKRGSKANAEPADLFELATVKARLAQKGADEIKKVPLQALRVRYPLGQAEDFSKTLFAVGLHAVVDVGVKVQSISRVGSQGAVDLHTKFFPDLFESAPNETLRAEWERRFAAQAYDLHVPPVALFGETG